MRLCFLRQIRRIRAEAESLERQERELHGYAYKVRPGSNQGLGFRAQYKLPPWKVTPQVKAALEDVKLLEETRSLDPRRMQTVGCQCPGLKITLT
jgi:hypothetical protein